jgi:hypothetical protein
VVSVVVPPGWSSFTEGDFGGVDILAGVVEGKFVAGSLCGGNFPACGHQFHHQSLACFFVEIRSGAAPKPIMVNEVPSVRCGVIFQCCGLIGFSERLGDFSELLRTFLPRKMRFERPSSSLLRATPFQTQCFPGSNAVLNLIDWEVPTASNPTALRNAERQNSGPELENGPPKSRRVI